MLFQPRGEFLNFTEAEGGRGRGLGRSLTVLKPYFIEVSCFSNRITFTTTVPLMPDYSAITFLI